MPDAEVRRQRAAFQRGVLRSAAVAGIVVALVVGLALIALNQARRAEEGQKLLRRHLYVAQMNVAQQAWDDGNVEQAVELLEAQRPGPWQDDLRGFEWRYLWRLCRQRGELFTFRGPARGAALAFSPDGKTLALTGPDGAVKLWDRASRREVATLTRLSSPWRKIQFASDGKTLVIVNIDSSRGNTMELWDVVKRRERASYPLGKVYAAPSRDGRSLILGRGTDTVKVWDLTSVMSGASAHAREVLNLTGKNWGNNARAISPDGRTFATANAEYAVELWDVATARRVAILPGHLGFVGSMRFSPNSKILATGSDDATVKLWDVATRQELATLRGHRAGVYALEFSADSSILATGGVDSTVKLWNVATKRELTMFRGLESPVIDLVFSPDNSTLAAISSDGMIKLWDAARRARDILQTRGAIMAISPDGKTLATGARPAHGVTLWNVTTTQPVATLPCQAAGIGSIAFSPDGMKLATGGPDHTLRLWEVATRRELATLWGPEPQRVAVQVRFSPDGKTLAATTNIRSGPGSPGEVRLWDVATKHEVAVLSGYRSGISALAYSSAGRILATGSVNGFVKLWDVSSRRERGAFTGDKGRVLGLAFSPDGKMLATAGDDKTVKLWNIADRGVTPAATLRGHAGAVVSVAFSPDGRTLASAGYDLTIKLWNVTMKQEVGSLRGHESNVNFIAFSPDGEILASGSADQTIRLWRAAPFAETDASPGQPLRR